MEWERCFAELYEITPSYIIFSNMGVPTRVTNNISCRLCYNLENEMGDVLKFLHKITITCFYSSNQSQTTYILLKISQMKWPPHSTHLKLYWIRLWYVSRLILNWVRAPETLGESRRAHLVLWEAIPRENIVEIVGSMSGTNSAVIQARV